MFGDQINRQTSLKTDTMNAVVLNKLLTTVTPKMHKVRRAALTSCVSRMLNGAKARIDKDTQFNFLTNCDGCHCNHFVGLDENY